MRAIFECQSVQFTYWFIIRLTDCSIFQNRGVCLPLYTLCFTYLLRKPRQNFPISTQTFPTSNLVKCCISPPSAVPPSGSAKCLRFGHWLTLCTLNIALRSTYLLTYRWLHLHSRMSVENLPRGKGLKRSRRRIEWIMGGGRGPYLHLVRGSSIWGELLQRVLGSWAESGRK